MKKQEDFLKQQQPRNGVGLSILKRVHVTISDLAVHVPAHMAKSIKESTVETSKNLTDVIMEQHLREETLSVRFSELERRYDYLARGKDILILRSISDRIEEMAICAVLSIDRDEMRKKKLFTLAHVKTRLGKHVKTFTGTTHTIVEADLETMETDLSRLNSSRQMVEGRKYIKAFGDLEAHEDPEPYIEGIDACIRNVFREAEKQRAVRAVVNFYKILRQQYGLVRAGAVPMDDT